LGQVVGDLMPSYCAFQEQGDGFGVSSAPADHHSQRTKSPAVNPVAPGSSQ